MVKKIINIFNAILLMLCFFIIPSIMVFIPTYKSNKEEKLKEYYIENYDKELNCCYLGDYYDNDNKYVIFCTYQEDEDYYIAFRYNKNDVVEIKEATYTIIYYNDDDYEFLNIKSPIENEYQPNILENVRVYDKEAFGESFRGYTNGRLDGEIIILFLLELLLVPISLILTILNIIIFIFSKVKKKKQSKLKDQY